MESLFLQLYAVHTTAAIVGSRMRGKQYMRVMVQRCVLGPHVRFRSFEVIV